MKRTHVIVLLVITFFLGCAVAPLVVPPLSAQQMATGAPRWEYTCYSDSGRLNLEQLNEYGQRGWELLGMPSARLCFKRRLP